MEKLIELLNEYEKELNTGLHWRIDEEYGMLWRGISLTGVEQYLISKHYGFIKRLVENDKIDLVKVYENLTNYEIEIRIRAVKELLENNEEDTIAYLKLLMLLSIQDEPIRFLCEILK